MIELRFESERAYLELKPEKGSFTILNVSTINHLIEKFTEISKTPAKTVCVYGHGGCFAVGANLKTMYDYDGFDAKGFSILGNKLFRLMRTMPQVVIGLIDGFCMGGGMDFAAACDFRLATKASKFAHPGSKLGIITGFGGTQALQRLMKPAYMTELLATGDIFGVDFIQESGFILNACDDTETMKEESNKLCKKICAKPRNILNEGKSFIFS